MRLIDADALVRRYVGSTVFVTEDEIDSAPTIDAVEVVRCKDCDFYMEAPWGSDMMCYNGLAEGFEFTAPDDYCSRGRRKDGGESTGA